MVLNVGVSYDVALGFSLYLLLVAFPTSWICETS